MPLVALYLPICPMTKHLEGQTYEYNAMCAVSSLHTVCSASFSLSCAQTQFDVDDFSCVEKSDVV